MNNILLITHKDDIDGMGSYILASLVFDKFDTIFINPDELKNTLENVDDYDQIYINDLRINKDIDKIIMDNKLNVLVFDHHETDEYIKERDYATIVPKINGKTNDPSGTSLFYVYLINNFDNEYIKKRNLEDLVEGIRSYDTYNFKNTNNLTGYILTTLFNKTSREEFNNTVITRIKESNDSKYIFTKEEMSIYGQSEKELHDYIEKCDKELIGITLLGYKAGLSISTKFRSSLGNELSKRHADEYDFILIADKERHTFSCRTVNDFNVAKNICAPLGGGGHDKAGGFPMNEYNYNLILKNYK